MMVRHDGVDILVKNQNGDDAGLKGLYIFHSDDAGLYEDTIDKLTILIEHLSDFLKKRDESPLFSPLPFHDCTKTLLK